jgi:hypothetical protein
MTEGPVPAVGLKQRRERTIQLLCEHFAQDRLDLADFEARLDIANRAGSVTELDVLLQDLPVARPAVTPVQPAAEALARGGRAVRDAVRDSRTLLALMGGVERRGHWTPARKNIVIAIMGGADLDFREVELPSGETEVFIFCMMGGAEIIVPPGLAVDASGIAIMGGFAHASAPARPDPDTPVLRIHGLCIMGGVDIMVRHVGESAKDARLREREERKALRDRSRQIRGRE